MAEAWHEDVTENTYRGAGVVTEDVADTISDFGLGHYLELDRNWSRPRYAYNAARKILSTQYFLLVKRISISGNHIGWNAIILHSPIDQIFGQISTEVGSEE